MILRLVLRMPDFIQRGIIKLVKLLTKEYRSLILRRIWKEVYDIEVGMGTYGCFQRGTFCAGDKIGNYCSIGANVWHLHADHPMDHACMSPLFYLKSFADNPKVVDIPRTKLTVGHDVWIGRDVKILSKVTTIGNGAVIGAGSVVTGNVEPYTVVAGVPARTIRRRFDDKIIALLESSRWWTLEPEQLAELQSVVNDPKAFAEAAEKLVENC